MTLKDFKYFLDVKAKSGVLYQKCENNRNICGQCSYRQPWKNNCKKFNRTIQKVNQRNGGFHHLPCENCLNYKIQQEDLNYFIECYKRRKNK